MMWQNYEPDPETDEGEEGRDYGDEQPQGAMWVNLEGEVVGYTHLTSTHEGSPLDYWVPLLTKEPPSGAG
jgi:hypothetical protein